MIRELETNQYVKVSSLLASFGYCLAVESIITGLTKARIFVDDAASPKSAFTWFKGRAWVAGEANNAQFNRALRVLLAKTYYRELATREAQVFILHYTTNWEPQTKAILGSHPRTRSLRHYYHLDATRQTRDVIVPDDFELHLINTSLLAEAGLENLSEVVDEMQPERLSIEDFLQKSFGYCVVHGKEIVGWCTSEYNTAQRCEPGIATVERYRKMGIATLTATVVIKHVQAHGITDIGWHCWADNKPSIATAQKLGFTKKCEYPVYMVSLEAEQTGS